MAVVALLADVAIADSFTGRVSGLHDTWVYIYKLAHPFVSVRLSLRPFWLFVL